MLVGRRRHPSGLLTQSSIYVILLLSLLWCHTASSQATPSTTTEATTVATTTTTAASSDTTTTTTTTAASGGDTLSTTTTTAASSDTTTTTTASGGDTSLTTTAASSDTTTTTTAASSDTTTTTTASGGDTSLTTTAASSDTTTTTTAASGGTTTTGTPVSTPTPNSGTSSPPANDPSEGIAGNGEEIVLVVSELAVVDYIPATIASNLNIDVTRLLLETSRLNPLKKGTRLVVLRITEKFSPSARHIVQRVALALSHSKMFRRALLADGHELYVVHPSIQGFRRHANARSTNAVDTQPMWVAAFGLLCGLATVTGTLHHFRKALFHSTGGGSSMAIRSKADIKKQKKAAIGQFESVVALDNADSEGAQPRPDDEQPTSSRAGATVHVEEGRRSDVQADNGDRCGKRDSPVIDGAGSAANDQPRTTQVEDARASNAGNDEVEEVPDNVSQKSEEVDQRVKPFPAFMAGDYDEAASTVIVVKGSATTLKATREQQGLSAAQKHVVKRAQLLENQRVLAQHVADAMQRDQVRQKDRRAGVYFYDEEEEQKFRAEEAQVRKEAFRGFVPYDPRLEAAAHLRESKGSKMTREAAAARGPDYVKQFDLL